MALRRAFYAARALTPFDCIDDAVVLIEGSRIEWIGPRRQAPAHEGAEVIDLGRATLAPGFVDIHVHGGGGLHCGESPEALFAVSRRLAAQGTTAFLPTLGGVADFEELLAQLRMVHEAGAAKAPGAHIAGIHLEGPFLSPDPRARGSQSVAAMRSPSVAEFDRMAEAAGGSLRYMTIAPELPGALAVIERMVAAGVVPSAGHTTASYQEMERAIAAGLKSVCHTFNGMPPMHHRDPGVVGAALTRPELNAELIADGHHVDPVVMRILYRAKGADGITLVTDNTRWAGLPDGRYPRPGGGAVIKERGRCWVEGGSLAGSVAPMNAIVRTFVSATGAPLAEAVQMASFNPARLVGLEGKGRLAPGCDADLVALDETLDVVLTVAGGEVVYRR